MFSPPLHAPVLDISLCSSLPHPASKQPVVLDLSQALSSTAMQEEQAAHPAHFLADHVVASGIPLPSMQTKDLPALGAELGSPECPTVGSQGHWLGVCKPCAFLHTKGCGNGVLCSFCHICNKGEKKRRSKDKRAAMRTGMQPERSRLLVSF